MNKLVCRGALGTAMTMAGFFAIKWYRTRRLLQRYETGAMSPLTVSSADLSIVSVPCGG